MAIRVVRLEGRDLEDLLAEPSTQGRNPQLIRLSCHFLKSSSDGAPTILGGRLFYYLTDLIVGKFSLFQVCLAIKLPSIGSCLAFRSSGE